MRVHNYFPYNSVSTLSAAPMPLQQALAYARANDYTGTWTTPEGRKAYRLQLAQYAREVRFHKPRGRLGYTFQEWDAAIREDGRCAFYQGSGPV